MPNPPPRTGMSGLYANLLDPSSSSSTTPTSISRAPIVFSQSTPGAPADAPSADPPTASSAQKKLNAAALRFQPTVTKRPHVKPAKPKTAIKPVTAAAVTSSSSSAPAVETAPRPIVKTTLEDWTGDGDDDVNGFYAASKHSGGARGGKKRRKKNKDTPPPPTNWDDVYDPSRPNSYEEYREGDEKIREMEDWRERVYGKRRRGGRDDSYDSEDDDGYKAGIANRFAPPSKYSFAPPPPPENTLPPPPPPPPAPTVEVPDDASGEDAYARRIRMSAIGQAGYAAAAPPPTISRAPILYTLPSAPPDSTLTSPTPPPPPPRSPSPPPERSLRPGQKDFATRLMSKYGWTSGTGLGADSTGIVQPLRMVAAKSKDQSGRGRIIDKNQRGADEGRFGKMSEVVVLSAMVDGLEDEDEAVLRQEIGEECSAKYGNVERVLVDWGRGEAGGTSRVFVQFTSQLSALRAVNALEGRLFNGNTIGARFFDKDKFDSRDFS